MIELDLLNSRMKDFYPRVRHSLNLSAIARCRLSLHGRALWEAQ
jgi:hypothetical protein